MIPPEVLSTLNERERRIFDARHVAKDRITLAVLASEFNISIERVRQIDARAAEKVRRAMVPLTPAADVK